MKRVVFLFCAIAITFIADAQTEKEKRPDFTGAWSLAPPRAGTRSSTDVSMNLGSGWGKQFTIIQTEDEMIVERVFFTWGDIQPPLKYRYSLTGAETRNTILMGRGYQEQVSTTAWDGEKLVIKTIFRSQNPVNGKTVNCEVTQILSISYIGSIPVWRSLVIETIRSGVLGGPSSKSRNVYIKK